LSVKVNISLNDKKVAERIKEDFKKMLENYRSAVRAVSISVVHWESEDLLTYKEEAE